MIKKKQKHLFALCVGIACIASSAVLIKCAQISDTAKEIQKVEAEVRDLFRPNAQHVPEISALNPKFYPPQSRPSSMLVAAQVRN